MPDTDPSDSAEPFFLIVADYGRNLFSVEGPMTDDRPWIAAARAARNLGRRRVVCGPQGTDREALAAEHRRIERMAGVPPGSIVRPRG